MKPNSTIESRFQQQEEPRLEGGWKANLWRICGWFGNRVWRRSPPAHMTSSGKHLLNLGCGTRRHEGWVNADFYRPQQLVGGGGPDWMLDLTEPFRCPSDHWDGVTLEHVNEHLLYSQNLRLFQEVLRTLKPGGVLRVAVPDLDRYLGWNQLRDEEPKFGRYGSLPEAVSNLTQNHAHRSVWNGELMCELLGEVGFGQARVWSFREGNDPELCAVDGESHRWESVYVEAIKPEAREAQRAA